jgi:hypothetical protein
MKIYFGWGKVLGTKLLDNTAYCEHLPLNQRCPNFSDKNATTINPLTPNSHYSGRTAPLTFRRSILNIYSTNIRAEYFKHAA